MKYATRLVAVYVASLFVFCSVSLSAQQWSAEEQALLKTMKKGWLLWSEGVEKKDLSIWVDGFEPVDDFRGWWTSEGGLWGLDDLDVFQDIYFKTVKAVALENISPVSIRIYGDTAITYSYMTIHNQDHDGNWTRYEEKRFETFIKRNGKWRWAGCMATENEIGVLK